MQVRVPVPAAKISGRILIVENACIKDEPLRPVLQSYGLEVVLAKKDSDVLALLENTGIDIVLIDTGMPIFDGFKLCRCIKQNQQTAHIPVLLVTTTDERNDRITSIEAGADDLLTKPITADELVLRVRNAIAGKKMYDQSHDNKYHLYLNEELREKLINMFVHDTSGSLQSILGNAELLKLKNAHKLNSEAVGYLDKIEGNSRSLMDLFVKFRDAICSEKGAPAA